MEDKRQGKQAQEERAGGEGGRDKREAGKVKKEGSRGKGRGSK